MPRTDSQRASDNRYRKEKTKLLAVRFYPSDMYVYDHVKSQENIAQYVKGLIRADMEKGGQ